MTTSAATSPAGQQPGLFQYTSGRWLYNEAQRFEERYKLFDVSALKKAAAAAVGRGINDVRSIVKIADGGFNRVFSISMADGLEVIARLPYKIAQPRHLAVASEVATIDFLWNQGFPVPRIYSYQHDQKNPVGSEYILMEKVRGQPLGDMWFNLNGQQRTKLLTEIVDIEARLLQLDFPACGSMFYEADLPQSMNRASFEDGKSSQSLCVGPDVSLRHWFEQRNMLNISRGPMATASDVLQSAAAKEIAFLHSFGKPRMPLERTHRDITEFRKSSPHDHLRSLEMFQRVAPLLVPQEAWLLKPTLRHPDLNPNNIFVAEDLQITGVIDWQHSCILPLFLTASIPAYFRAYGDAVSEALTKPSPPPAEDGLDEDERERDLELYHRRHLNSHYLDAIAKKANNFYKALTDKNNLFRQRLYRHAGAPWEGDNITLRADLIKLAKHWKRLVPLSHDGSVLVPCPLSFDQGEVEWTKQAAEKQDEADQQMRILKDMIIGCGPDGWVSTERFAAASTKVSSLKQDAIAAAEDDAELEEIVKAWPFDDFNESE